MELPELREPMPTRRRRKEDVLLVVIIVALATGLATQLQDLGVIFGYAWGGLLVRKRLGSCHKSFLFCKDKFMKSALCA
jgi:hypothetical protein